MFLTYNVTQIYRKHVQQPLGYSAISDISGEASGPLTSPSALLTWVFIGDVFVQILVDKNLH